MHNLDDVPMTEIASVLSIPLFTAYSRLRKARKELESANPTTAARGPPMSRLVPPLSPEARALLDQERSPPVQPAAVRLRALSRARAALTAFPHPSPPARGKAHGTRWFIATTLTCAAAVAAGMTAYQVRAHFASETPAAGLTPQPRAKVQAGATRTAPDAKTEIRDDANGERANRPAAAGPLAAPPVRARPAAGPLSRADAAALELRMLQPARAAVAREDFAAALGPIAEHARRFKDGRLAEEREALRVKALAGLGRPDDARRAAAAFKVRFPRSVLLPAVSRLAEPGP